ncbi:hypothetical protein HWV62_13894 [Athelia sp. TMB]|nr:hypothetical protein HWV62_14742 [Athelia sp. TMB]KAF7973944.1 hypothetical protein HWV62_13894 [Athelia sp. TMB]
MCLCLKTHPDSPSLRPLALLKNKMTSLILTPEELLNRARDTVGKFSCEWKNCNRVMNCWSLLDQHLVRHCKKGYNSNLKPIYIPSAPVLVVSPPPLQVLPNTSSLTTCDLLPVRPGSQKHKGAYNAIGAGLSRKWSRLTAQDKDVEEDVEDVSVELEDLTPFLHSPDPVLDLVSRLKPPEAVNACLSAPCRIINPPPSDADPPTSILWDTFVIKVDEQVAATAIDAMGDAVRTVTIRQPP